MGFSMEEAFKKTGHFQSELQARKNARKKAEQAEKKRITEERKKEEEENRRQREEANKIYKPFNDRWHSPKKAFLIHLLYSFVPAGVAQYAEADQDLKEKKCCICDQSLVSKQNILSNHEKFADIALGHLHKLVKGEPTDIRQSFVQIIGDVQLGVVSPYSSAAFCPSCYQNFYSWIEIMLLQGNHQINEIIDRRRLELSFSEAELKEYRSIIKEKDPKVMRQNLNSFLERTHK